MLPLNDHLRSRTTTPSISMKLLIPIARATLNRKKTPMDTLEMPATTNMVTFYLLRKFLIFRGKYGEMSMWRYIPDLAQEPFTRMAFQQQRNLKIC